MGRSSVAVTAAVFSGYLAAQAGAYNPTQTSLSCTNLIAVSCVAKGLSQCCVAGGDCCPDGSCCGVGQTCLQSGSGYQCCNTSTDCPNASSASSPGSTPFHAQIPCSPAEGDSWYCDFGQSCGLSTGSCIGVASGGGSSGGGSSGGGSTSSGGSSTSGDDSGDSSSSPTPSSGNSNDGASSSASPSSSSNAAPGRHGGKAIDVMALFAMLFVV